MRRRTNIIWVVVCVAVMVICIALGAYYRQGYIGLGGVIFCCVGLTILGIINKIMALREINRAIKEVAQEDADNPQNAGELIQACFGFTKETKRKLKVAPTRDKVKVIAIFASLGLLLFTMFVGIILARIGTYTDGTVNKIAIIGFILMGIGGGGFFLEIVAFAIISGIKNRK